MLSEVLVQGQLLLCCGPKARQNIIAVEKCRNVEEATHLMVAKKQRAQEMPGTVILKYASLVTLLPLGFDAQDSHHLSVTPPCDVSVS